MQDVAFEVARRDYCRLAVEYCSKPSGGANNGLLVSSKSFVEFVLLAFIRGRLRGKRFNLKFKLRYACEHYEDLQTSQHVSGA